MREENGLALLRVVYCRLREESGVAVDQLSYGTNQPITSDDQPRRFGGVDASPPRGR